MEKIPVKASLLMVVKFWILLFLPPVASAQGKIPIIPPGWPTHIQNSMNIARDTLVKHLKDYDKRVDDFNGRCTGTIDPENRSLIAACQTESDAIDVLADAIGKEKERFLATFRENEKIFLPNTDPTVVDTRNARIPTGMDNAIAKAYKDAGPEVSERVRKGFQAVNVNDWKLARAWFEDALFHDPGDPGLKSFINLCNYSMDMNKMAASVTPAAITADQLSRVEKNVLNVWIQRVREAAKKGEAVDATADLPASAMDKIRRYVYGLTEAEREDLFFPQDFTISLILYDMQK